MPKIIASRKNTRHPRWRRLAPMPGRAILGALSSINITSLMSAPTGRAPVSGAARIAARSPLSPRGSVGLAGKVTAALTSFNTLAVIRALVSKVAIGAKALLAPGGKAGMSSQSSISTKLKFSFAAGAALASSVTSNLNGKANPGGAVSILGRGASKLRSVPLFGAIASLAGAAHAAVKSPAIFSRLSVLTATAKITVRVVSLAAGKVPLAAKAAAKAISSAATSLHVPLGIDGVATGNSSTSILSATLTTTNTSDVIVAIIGTFGAGQTQTVNSVFGGGLSWMPRSAHVYNDVSLGVSENTELWWASTSSILNAVSVTATLNAPGPNAESEIILFGVKGANTSAPFDTNGSLPAFNNLDSQTSAVVGVSTDSNPSMIIGATTALFLTSPSIGSGYTEVASEVGPGLGNSATVVEQKIVSSQQSNVTVGFGSDSSSASAVMMADAIRGLTVIQALMALASVAFRTSITAPISSLALKTKVVVGATAASFSTGTLPILARAFSFVKGFPGSGGNTSIAATATIAFRSIPNFGPIAFLRVRSAITKLTMQSAAPTGALAMSGIASLAAKAKSSWFGRLPIVGSAKLGAKVRGPVTGVASVSGRAVSNVLSTPDVEAALPIAAVISRVGAAIKTRSSMLGAAAMSGAAQTNASARPGLTGATRIFASASTAMRSKVSSSMSAAITAIVASRASARPGLTGATRIFASASTAMRSKVSSSMSAAITAIVASRASARPGLTGATTLFGAAMTQYRSAGLLSASLSILGRTSSRWTTKAATSVGASLKTVASIFASSNATQIGATKLLGAMKLQVKVNPGLTGYTNLAGRAVAKVGAKVATTYGAALSSILRVSSKSMANAAVRLPLIAASALESISRKAAISLTTHFVEIAGAGLTAVRATSALTITFLPVLERTIAINRTRVIAVTNRVRTLIAKW